jgi:hypothetical protein
MIRRIARLVLVVVLLTILLAAAGCDGNVYMSVGVAGPYGAYGPYGPYGGWGGGVVIGAPIYR